MSEAHRGWLAFPLTIKPKAPFSRTELQMYLEENDIQTRPVFTGNILRQPAYKELAKTMPPTDYPEADLVMERGMLLACHHGLTGEQVAYMHDKLTQFFRWR